VGVHVEWCVAVKANAPVAVPRVKSSGGSTAPRGNGSSLLSFLVKRNGPRAARPELDRPERRPFGHP